MNQATHKLGVPLVLFHILAMLEWIDLIRVPGTELQFTAAHALILVVAPWYLALAPLLALAVGAVAIAFVWLAPHVPVPVVLGITVLAWTLQLVGHYVYEKRSPSFFKNIHQLLVGPLFIAALLLGRWKGPQPAA